METNPYKPPNSSMDGEPLPVSTNGEDDALAEPVVAYTASGNLEAHSVVSWFASNGVRAYAVEDDSGVSLSPLVCGETALVPLSCE